MYLLQMTSQVGQIVLRVVERGTHCRSDIARNAMGGRNQTRDHRLRNSSAFVLKETFDQISVSIQLTSSHIQMSHIQRVSAQSIQWFHSTTIWLNLYLLLSLTVKISLQKVVLFRNQAPLDMTMISNLCWHMEILALSVAYLIAKIIQWVLIFRV